MILGAAMDDLTIDRFLPYLHQVFTIVLEGGDPYPLELVQVTEIGAAPGPGYRRPFSLIFRNPDKTVYLPQRTYHLEHESAGSLDLFIVPLGPDTSGMQYQAIIS